MDSICFPCLLIVNSGLIEIYIARTHCSDAILPISKKCGNYTNNNRCDSVEQSTAKFNEDE